MARQINVTYRDLNGTQAIMGFLVDDSFDDGTYAEILAFVQDLRDATECHIEKVTLIRTLDISGLTNGVATRTGPYSTVDDQAVLSFRSDAGLDTKLTIPAPVGELFVATGSMAEKDIDPASVPMAALKATGWDPVDLLVDKVDSPLQFRKGWRRGQRHS